MVSVIVVARVLDGGPITTLSVALPLLGLGWLAGLGIKMRRLAPAGVAAPAPKEPDERPSRPLRRVKTQGGPRSDRPSDSGRHVNA
ncbi:MAG TPA: hypothetical protein VEX18_09865 [Polyangiaceae bacterium]|nr:hypothetical protein [Polyangiaceae bacterium]